VLIYVIAGALRCQAVARRDGGRRSCDEWRFESVRSAPSGPSRRRSAGRTCSRRDCKVGRQNGWTWQVPPRFTRCAPLTPASPGRGVEIVERWRIGQEGRPALAPDARRPSPNRPRAPTIRRSPATTPSRCRSSIQHAPIRHPLLVFQSAGALDDDGCERSNRRALRITTCVSTRERVKERLPHGLDFDQEARNRQSGHYLKVSAGGSGGSPKPAERRRSRAKERQDQ